jgi:hypothetical protein
VGERERAKETTKERREAEKPIPIFPSFRGILGEG